MLFGAALLRAQGAGAALSPEFPFEFREGLIWVRVHTPQSAQPLNFLLDTGAGVSVINLRTAEKLGLKAGNRVSVQGVGATAAGYWPEHLAATAGEVSLPAEYLAVDLSELSGACACPVDGLIGADFFRGRVVQIDFAARRVRLLASSAPAAGQQIVPLKTRQNALRVPARINGGAAQWLRLDTGCASSLQWVTPAARAGAHRRQLAVALNGISIPVAQTTVQLGRACFKDVPTGLHDKTIFAGEAGLLGNGILSRFACVTVDANGGWVGLRR
jgi:predicted aspartyl protease